MDNFHIDVTCESTKANLRTCMDLVFTQHNVCIGYSLMKSRDAQKYPIPEAAQSVVHPYMMAEKLSERPTALILHWSDYANTATKLPFTMNVEQTTDFVWTWLNYAHYGEEPDHDGSNEKGFRVFTESWGHVNDDHSTMCAIAPAWAMYGK